ncbi:Mername-AA168 protein (M67 family) [Schistosoma mansoni]|uniref:Mername-AA168 protein (M67 family) n=1 Tax=Schistosoma mansoni TaxID=6183 RepID=UPI00022DC525|nr:Mername-AA168 protein (M67 family) [Schistosoma mansoni]|eukprot:XP_018648703.1 Mername-AA168 protein (M67 family) [Schistosoma mansoni]
MDFQSKISKTIDRVQVEGKVFLKMIKHYEEESVSSQNFVNGVLLGLAQGSQLEITNCFPLPKTQEDDPNANEALVTYEANMIRNLRQLQTDYLNVGFYQAGPGGVSINRANIENIYQRQINLPESVLLTYDPTRTSRGQIGLKAYRLSDDVLAARSEAEDRFRLMGHKGPEVPWECEAASSVGRSSFTRVLEEIPVVIHNSHLVNILLTEIVDNQELSRSELSTNSSMLDLAPPLPKDHPGRYSTLNLSMASSLEQQLRSLLAGLETVHDYQYSYQRSLSKSQATVAGKTATETRNRELAPIRLDTALVSAQLDFYCNSLAQMAGQTIGKLMLTQAVQKTSSSGAPKSQKI